MLALLIAVWDLHLTRRSVEKKPADATSGSSKKKFRLDTFRIGALNKTLRICVQHIKETLLHIAFSRKKSPQLAESGYLAYSLYKKSHPLAEVRSSRHLSKKSRDVHILCIEKKPSTIGLPITGIFFPYLQKKVRQLIAVLVALWTVHLARQPFKKGLKSKFNLLKKRPRNEACLTAGC